MRVVVVQHESSGDLIKVCADESAFESWLDRSDWERYQLHVSDARVFRA